MNNLQIDEIISTHISQVGEGISGAGDTNAQRQGIFVGKINIYGSPLETEDKQRRCRQQVSYQ